MRNTDNQILTNDDEVCIPCLSSILLAVTTNPCATVYKFTVSGERNHAPPPYWNRINKSENLRVTAVKPVSPVVTPQNMYHHASKVPYEFGQKLGRSLFAYNSYTCVHYSITVSRKSYWVLAKIPIVLTFNLETLPKLFPCFA